MLGHAFCVATFLFYFYHFAIAAPPLNKPSSLSLSITNLTLPILNNSSLSASDV